jgi:steroid delta-isomerase-like uncharacterized protein
MATQAVQEQLTDETLQELARSWDEAWSARDASRIADHLTEDAVYEDPALPEIVHGRAAFREQVQNILNALPDIEVRQETIFRALDDAQLGSTHWRFAGTFQQTMLPLGFAPTGQRIEVEGMALVEVRGDKVARLRQFYDTTGFGRQAGAVPPRGSRMERLGLLFQKRTARRMRKGR